MSEDGVTEEQEIYATLVEINQQPTELYKILKFESLVSGGGEAKQVIAQGYVSVNGELETRKRRKIYAGDLVSFNNQYLQIALKGETQEYELVEDAPQQKAEEERGSVSKLTESAGKTKKSRKPISF